MQTPFYDPLRRLARLEETFGRRLGQQMDMRSSYRVVDLGCGTALLSLRIEDAAPTISAIGLDADPAALELAKHKAAQARLDVCFDGGDAVSISSPGGSFDQVASSSVFHHLDSGSKHMAATKAFPVLRVGGELHVAVWGKPRNALMRVAFLGIQLLDGFATTAENVSGALPLIFRKAGFEDVRERARLTAVCGTLTLYSGRRTAANRTLSGHGEPS